MILMNEEEDKEVKHGDLRDNEVYQELSKRKKKLLIRSILLTGFLLGVNVYAWFIFVQQFGGNFDANVVSWDVIAFDENQQQIDELALNIDGLNDLQNGFPFKVTFASNMSTIPSGADATFTVTATWAYESQVPYFKVNQYMHYDSEYKYYTRSGSTYTEASVNASNWSSMVANNLYMESDDADTYFGHLSSVYQTDNPGEPCLKIFLELKVDQQAT